MSLIIRSTLIGEMKNLFDEMKTSREASQNHINILISEMKISQNKVNTLINEMKTSRQTSQDQRTHPENIF